MFPNPADQFRARLAEPQTLAGLLPWVVDSLSIARGQMLVDQLAKKVQSNNMKDLLILVVERATPHASLSHQFDVVGAAIAQIIPPGANREAGEAENRTATILFAGRAPHSFAGERQREELLQATSLLTSTLDSELAARGIQFVQWAQDTSEEVATGFETGDDSSIVKKRAGSSVVGRDSWPELLGFQRLATLCYMRCDLQETIDGIQSEQPLETLRMAPVGHQATEKRDFESLVERTYVGTLDCPSLSQFQTTTATLDGYRASPVFAPDLWFEAKVAPATTVGCLVLARHGGTRKNGNAAASNGPPVDALRSVLEVVYMGVVPEHRGCGLGAQLVRITLELARKAGCESVILAVDTKNSPARAAYELAGFVSVLLEEVWGKRLLGGKIEASKNEST